MLEGSERQRPSLKVSTSRVCIKDADDSGIAMEHYFIAECDFQSKFLNTDLEFVASELDLPSLNPSSLDKAVHAAQRAVKEGFVMEKLVPCHGSLSESVHLFSMVFVYWGNCWCSRENIKMQ